MGRYRQRRSERDALLEVKLKQFQAARCDLMGIFEVRERFRSLDVRGKDVHVARWRDDYQAVVEVPAAVSASIAVVLQQHLMMVMKI